MKLTSILGVPAMYSLFQDVLGGSSRREYVAKYVRAQSGNRVLDIGCGTGDVLDYLPADVEYTGFDTSEDYIASAQGKFGDRGRFFCEQLTRSLTEQFSGFDIVLANGVLHHLNDSQAVDLLKVAQSALRKGGRLVSLDGCYVEGQSRLARYLLSRDRGEFVRNEAQYLALAAPIFPRVTIHVRHDLLRVPYTHIIMECTQS